VESGLALLAAMAVGPQLLRILDEQTARWG